MSAKKRWGPTGFGGRLQQLRGRAGLTQAELAGRAGVFPLTISKLERGVHEPAWPLVVALARALAVSCDAFLADGDGSPAAPPPKGRPRKAPPAAQGARSGAGPSRKLSGEQSRHVGKGE